MLKSVLSSFTTRTPVFRPFIARVLEAPFLPFLIREQGIWTLLFRRVHNMAESSKIKTVKTRILIVSDTHSHAPNKKTSSKSSFNDPLPKCDIFIHAGDMTNSGQQRELEKVVEWISKVDAEVKIVIAGNHDMGLDAQYCRRFAAEDARIRDAYQPEAALTLFTSPAAVAAGIAYLHDETRTFTLSTGATFTVHGSPWQPDFYDWAFNYPHHLDRWNPGSDTSTLTTAIPAGVDILVTHGPPRGVLDAVRNPAGEMVGCPWLKLALERVRPRMHVFGHIHESQGVARIRWSDRNDVAQREKIENIETQLRAVAVQADARGADGWFDSQARKLFGSIEENLSVLRKEDEKEANGCTRIDVSEAALNGGIDGPLRYGRETLAVNASIMSVNMRPMNRPVFVEMDLPTNEDHHVERPADRVSDQLQEGSGLGNFQCSVA